MSIPGNPPSGPPPWDPSGYGQAGYGQAGYGPTPPPPRGTNAMAIAALVVSLAACAPIGMVLGFVALRQIRETGEDGRTMALVAIWFGVATIALLVLAFVLIVGAVVVVEVGDASTVDPGAPTGVGV